MQLAVAAFELGGVSLKKMSNLQAGSEPAANRSPIQAYRQSRAGSMSIQLTSILFKPTGNREQVSKKSQAVSEPGIISKQSRNLLLFADKLEKHRRNFYF